MIWRACCLAAALLATGCSSLPPTRPANAEAAETTASARQTGPWSGRLSLLIDSEPVQGFHAGFELSGEARQGELKLFSPLGATLASARWSPGSALLLRGDAVRAYPGLGALTADLTGAELPVSELFDWLQGRLTEAAGWQIDLDGIADGRLRAHRQQPAPAATLRIVLDRAAP